MDETPQIKCDFKDNIFNRSKKYKISVNECIQTIDEAILNILHGERANISIVQRSTHSILHSSAEIRLKVLMILLNSLPIDTIKLENEEARIYAENFCQNVRKRIQCKVNEKINNNSIDNQLEDIEPFTDEIYDTIVKSLNIHTIRTSCHTWHFHSVSEYVLLHYLVAKGFSNIQNVRYHWWNIAVHYFQVGAERNPKSKIIFRGIDRLYVIKMILICIILRKVSYLGISWNI